MEAFWFSLRRRRIHPIASYQPSRATSHTTPHRSTHKNAQSASHQRKVRTGGRNHLSDTVGDVLSGFDLRGWDELRHRRDAQFAHVSLRPTVLRRRRHQLPRCDPH